MSLAGVDLNLLVALDALLAERNVTRAAERVGLSQPGMSNTLARLRKLFGDPLLVREGLTLVPTPRAESLRQPVAEALSLVQHALDDRPGFDPATDPATFTVSCSDYSLLMLIGPLVRRLAAAAPGLTIQVLPRAPDPVRLLRDGDADLVIEPVEIMPEVTLPSLRLFADRWICCVWEGTTEVGDVMTMETYLRLGHLVYSAVRGPGLDRRHLPGPGRGVAPDRVHRGELPARAVPAAGHRPGRRGARAGRRPPAPHGRRAVPRAAHGPAPDHRDAVVEPAPHHGPGARMAPRPHRRDRRRTRPARGHGRTRRLTGADRSPGQAREPLGEDPPVDQPRMPGMRPVRAHVYPAGHLDQRAPADDGLVPPQLAGPDRDPGLPLVAADEPPGQHPAEHPDERPLPARHAQGRLAELQRGEPDVVRPRREQRGAPVEHGHPVTVGEQVERVQVAVADDVRGRTGRVISQPAGRIYEVRSAEFAGKPCQRREQARYRQRDVADLLQLTAHQVGIERVQPCHRGDQQIRNLPQQPRHGRRGQPVKAG